MQKLLRLKPKVTMLTNFYVLDVETGDIEDLLIRWRLNARPESFIFGVIYGLNYCKVIHSLQEFIETLLEPRFKGCKIFAHNATYDLGTLFGNIFYLDPKALFNGSRFIACTNGNCTFADSYNIFVGQKVETIGKQIGILKKGMDGGQYKFSDWNNSYERADDINGCIIDCQIIWEALLSTFEFAGDIKITQASLSMTYFRRHHQPYTIEHNENTKHFWDSYYGGRTEAFKIGRTHSEVWDINSSYPKAMRDCVFPNPRNLQTADFVTVKQALELINGNYEGCLYANILHRDTTYGFLPVKMAGKLFFPTGNITGCWNFNEIKFALQSGAIEIKKVTKITFGEPMESPFIKYVETLFDLKLKAEIEGNEFERDRTKRFASSLYGKFAQRIDEESIYLFDIDKQIHLIEEAVKKKIFKKLSLFNAERKDAFLIVGIPETYKLSYSIPSFASYITSFSRLLLMKELIKNEKYRPVYCDTDSIFYELSPDKESSKVLGEWKKENKIVTEIRGLKNYLFIDASPDPSKGGELIYGKETLRLKGVPMKGVIKTGENSYEYTNLSKMKESIRHGKDSGVITKRTKTISNLYTKRIVFANGETKPIKL